MVLELEAAGSVGVEAVALVYKFPCNQPQPDDELNVNDRFSLLLPLLAGRSSSSLCM